MHLVGIPQQLACVRLTAVDHEQDRVVVARKRQLVEQVGQRASGRKCDVKAPQRPCWRGPLQRRVQVDGDGESYQLKILSRSASAVS